MLPHGTRPAQTPRSTRPTSNSAVASQVSAMATLPARRPGPEEPGGSAKSTLSDWAASGLGAPAPTDTNSGDMTRWPRAAKLMAKVIRAAMSTSIEE